MIQSFRLATTLALTAWLLGAGASARAGTRLDVSAGWEGQSRADRWAPIFVTATGDKPRNAVLMVSWPSTVYTMGIRQFVAIDSNSRTFKLALPMRGWGYMQASFTLVDADSGKTLASFPPDYSSGSLNIAPVDDNTVFVGISGRRTSLDTLQTAIQQLKTGYLEPRLLPESAMGFDALDVLVLNEPVLAAGDNGLPALSDDQQQAIVDWVRAGGNLVILPGENRIPASSPLADVLPAKMGALHHVELSEHDVLALGLEPRFAHLSAFQLDPQPGAREIKLLGTSALSGYARQVGLGRVALAPMNLSDLQTTDGQSCRKIWMPMLKGMVAAADEATSMQPTVNNTYQNQQAEQQQQYAAGSRIADFLGDVKGAGAIGFSFIAAVLVGLLLLVGPIDWFVLKRNRCQPWTWATTSGWIALLTLAAVFAGHMFKSGNLDYRTLRMIDQVGDATVASTDFVSLYSPRTQEYEFQTAGGWWTPGAEQEYGSGQMGADMPFHQGIDSNTPEPMQVHIWSLRSLRGDTIGAGPGMIRADLKIERIAAKYSNTTFECSGTIRNLSDRPLRNLRIASSHGTGVFTLSSESASATTSVDARALVVSEIPPHGEASVKAVLTGTPDQFESQTLYGNSYGGIYNSQTPRENEVWLLAGQLNVHRMKRIESLVKAGAQVCVYGEFADPAPVVTLVGTPDHQQHWQFIRAVTELRGER